MAARNLVLILVAAVLFAGCTVSRNPVTGRKRAYAYTWEQERQIGQQADQQIVAQFGVYNDQDLTNYVNQVGQRVLAQSHLRRADADPELRNTPFTFRVLDSPVVNAFALPGGFIYVTRGLLANLENEAQLAVVLGHEIGHVAARHASQQALQSQLGQLGIIGGAILGQEVLGLPAGDLAQLGGQAAQLLLLSYSRDAERESDQLGVEYAALTGYKAEEGAAFFTSLKRLSQAQQGGEIPTFLSTHPDPGQREQRIHQLAQEWAAKGTQMTEVDEQQYLNEIDGITLGEDPRQGFVENNVFYHPELRFSFPVPQGWLVQNEPTQVVMIDPNQQAVMGFTISEARSAAAAAQGLAGQQGITVVESGGARVGNLPAYYAIVDAQTQDGQQVRALSYYIEYGGKVYNLIGYSTAGAFRNYQNTFQRTMRGFAPVSDPNILNAQPVRLDVVRASRTAAFSSFIPQGLRMTITPEELAIMNQVQLNTTIRSGTMLKLPAR